jgi:thiol-disulfide isomerase/thioredoxin
MYPTPPQDDFPERLRRSFIFSVKATLLIVAVIMAFYYTHGDAYISRAQNADQAEELLDAYGLQTYAPVQFQQVIEKSYRQPQLFFVYTSWCPYCRQQFPLINEAALSPEGIGITALSIDKEPKRLVAYFEQNDPIHFTPYIIPNPDEVKKLIAIMQAQNLTFKGNIPYFAVFHDGKPIAEIRGALEKDVFNDMLADIRSEINAEEN